VRLRATESLGRVAEGREGILVTGPTGGTRLVARPGIGLTRGVYGDDEVAPGPADKELMQHGWRTFLVKVHNEAGVTAPLRVSSPQAAEIVRSSSGSPDPEQTVSEADVRDRWMSIAKIDRQPMRPRLSGLKLE